MNVARAAGVSCKEFDTLSGCKSCNRCVDGVTHRQCSANVSDVPALERACS